VEVVPSVSFRDESFDGQSEKRFSFVAKQFFGLRVYEDDLALLIAMTIESGADSSRARNFSWVHG
jgi:hypothetical protein